ncbi:hypothetical protein [Haloarcula marismortui]|uniref:hypothetical protein n=1 Tax=Haloarcula marismortui TaxID=2238 RepID=UPI003B834083
MEITISPGASGLSIDSPGTNTDRVELLRTFEGPNIGEKTIATEKLEAQSTPSGDANTFVQLGSNSERYVTLSDDAGASVIVSDGETAEVTTAGEINDGGSNSITLQQGDIVRFDVTSDNQVTVVNENSGSSFTFDPLSDSLTLASSAELTFEDEDGTTTALTAVNGIPTAAFETAPSSDVFLIDEEFGSGGSSVSEVNIIAIKGSGADQINLEASTITTIGPSGTNTLTYGGSSATEGDTFGVQAVQDEDDSLPVMTDADRFRIIVDPGTLETGETMTLELTTESGATTEIRVSVPNTLSGETAVQV